MIAFLGIDPLVAGIRSGGPAAGASAGDLEPASKVTAVTVYRDRARITRSAVVDVRPGESRVRFKDLPAVLEPESARVSGRGAAGVTILSLEMRHDTEIPKPGPEVGRIEKEIESLQQERSRQQERLKSVDFLRDLLTQFRGALATGTAAEASPTTSAAMARPVDLELWQRGFGFLSERLDTVATEKLQLEESVRTIERTIEARRTALLPSRTDRRAPSWIAEIDLSAARAATVTLALTYLSPDASWSPVYDARLLPVEGRLALSAFGQVFQNTGEDWSDVEVTLSSTRPLAALDLPRLASLSVRAAGASGGFVKVARRRGQLTESIKVLGANFQDELAMEGGVVGGTVGGVVGGVLGGVGQQLDVDGINDVEGFTLPSALAQVETRAAGQVFHLAGRLDIPSDGQSHRHLILERDLEATVEYRSAPALDRSVYLVAKATLPGDVTLLPGSIQHFVEEDLVGRSTLRAVPGGSPLELGFGPEDRVVVERREEEKRVPKGGDDLELRRRFATTMRNQLGRPVTVQVTERLPISEDAHIRVTLDDRETTGGGTEHEKDRGVFRWSMTLPPAATKDLVFAYSVRAPRDLPLELAAARP